MARKSTVPVSAAKEKKLQSGLMAKMLLFTVIPIIVILIITGIFLLSQVKGMMYDLKKADIDAEGESAAKSVDIYFSPYFTAAEIIADNEYVQQLASKAYSSSGSSAFQKDKANMDAAIAALQNATANLGSGVSIFISVETNNQVLFSDGSYYDNSLGVDVNTRLWYQLVKENPNKISVTSAYVDTVTGGLVVTVSAGIYNGSTLVGVVGMDIALDSLVKEFSGITIGETGYLTVYDSAGMVLYHPDSSLQMTPMSDIGYSDNMLTALNANADSHAMEYTRKGIEYCGSVTYSESTNWRIISCMPSDEFNQEVNLAKNIVNGSFGLCILILIVIIVLVALAITVPIKTLNTAVGKLAEGNLDVEIKATSKNEIGQLADSVIRLVERLKTYILY
ncbi:MAG: Cache 3/Cache 2 fusion domain-containing protein, partial [Oscillospiraceae bacterium]|nr:Cache 3/Cache 2 fusion domain-containing protein [Oscillospiraceae bacterium]